jgi:hypothetical protein
MFCFRTYNLVLFELVARYDVDDAFTGVFDLISCTIGMKILRLFGGILFIV